MALPPEISIIIPSIAKTEYLVNLFNSLKIQDCKHKTEVLLCITNAPKNFLLELPQLPQNFLVRLVSSPEPSISDARNRGIQAARGNICLFIDEDCSLPNKDYLNKVSSKISAHINYCGGGHYTNPNKLGYIEKSYNYICNVWLKKHYDQNKDSNLLLGGCSFYPTRLIKETGASFPHDYPTSGEEYVFNSYFQNANYALNIDQNWDVIHQPQINFKQFIMKAWKQGKSLNLITKYQSKKSTFTVLKENFSGFIIFAPMIVVFYLVGRSSYQVLKIKLALGRPAGLMSKPDGLEIKNTIV